MTGSTSFASLFVTPLAKRAGSILRLPAEDPVRVREMHQSAVNNVMLLIFAWNLWYGGPFDSVTVFCAATAFLNFIELMHGRNIIIRMIPLTRCNRELLIENRMFTLARVLALRVALFGADTVTSMLTLALLLLTNPSVHVIARKAYESAFRHAVLVSAKVSKRPPLAPELRVTATFACLFIASLFLDKWFTSPRTAFIHITAIALYAIDVLSYFEMMKQCIRFAFRVGVFRNPHISRFILDNTLYITALASLVQDASPGLASFAFPLLAPLAVRFAAIEGDEEESDSSDSDSEVHLKHN